MRGHGDMGTWGRGDAGIPWNYLPALSASSALAASVAVAESPAALASRTARSSAAREIGRAHV
mgnify:CR=1 FL=1